VSLDVYLYMPTVPDRVGGPEREPEDTRGLLVFTDNVTHNLGPMARAAEVYDVLWAPEENGYTTARSLIKPIREGIFRLRTDPSRFRSLDAPNGYGTYDNLLAFMERYLQACVASPQATVRVWR
jgi:hypothetical protein